MSKEKQASAAPMMVHRVTLSSGKVVILREMKVKYQNQAMQICGAKAKDNQAYLGSMMQEELLKLLIVEIDGKAPTAAQLVSIDDLFTYQEYLQLGSVLAKVIGGGDLGEFQLELSNIGPS